MDALSYKTISANEATAEKEWLVIDATGLPLGRLCSEISKMLRGKHKPCYTPHADCGDNVIVINAEKAILTGNKWNERVYHTYSGYPGGQRSMTPQRLMERRGADALYRKVVKGMLPKNRLSRQQITNLYIYEGSEHKHEAQQPKVVDLQRLKKQ
ncbi:MAG: 50S ribosomal protein L13 [Porphyromonas sp.]|nr:50S ribosomal protein L13 [Porphyromonas sp.]